MQRSAFENAEINSDFVIKNDEIPVSFNQFENLTNDRPARATNVSPASIYVVPPAEASIAPIPATNRMAGTIAAIPISLPSIFLFCHFF